MNTMNPIKGTEEQVASVASKLFNEVLDAHESRDYSKVVSVLSESAKQALTEQVFHDAIDNQLQALGQATERIYFGSARKKECTLTVWKVVYERGGQEILWQVLLTSNGIDVKVAGLSFS